MAEQSAAARGEERALRRDSGETGSLRRDPIIQAGQGWPVTGLPFPGVGRPNQWPEMAGRRWWRRKREERRGGGGGGGGGAA